MGIKSHLITPELSQGSIVILIDWLDSDGFHFDVGPENPENVRGVIKGEDPDYDDRVIVNWFNGFSNSYIPQNLKIVK